MPESGDRTESIFAAAIAMPPEQRAAYLDQACAESPTLRKLLDGLLRAHEKSEHLLDQPAAGGPEQTAAYVPGEPPGAVIAGRYKLLESIGEGGMGTVWVAEQSQPVRRKVAVKLIKAGMDSRSVLARFEAERQALALMDHPNIAKVLDGGLTDAGRPYFVMEYVKGVPITEYCDVARLKVAERLQLFTQVCQAVQHAHQKGIIHRDLKPSNILVAPYDDRPVPKIIDFGLAKAIHQSLTERTLHTAHEAVLGTPLYMSPEQAQLNNLDVDTRSDIYSLGVLLYELLTGTTPLEKQRFKEAAWDEVRRIIREEDPPRPSTRLSSIATLPSLAAGRQTEPAKLSKLLRGDLDWITMKALEKDRTRRYETANGLARDIQRYLSDEPVEACPPSATYRLRKFARKNRAAIATATAFALLLTVGAGVAFWQAARAAQAERIAVVHAKAEEEQRRAAEDQRDRAIKAEKDAQEAAAREAAERHKAEAKEAEANAVVRFFEEKVFAAGRPKGEYGGLGHEVLLRDAIRASLPALANSFRDQPIVEARLRRTLGTTFWCLGDSAQGVEQLEQALVLLRRHLGRDHPSAIGATSDLANNLAVLNRLAEALQLREEALAACQRILPPDDPGTLDAMNNLALSYRALNRDAEALKLTEETLAAQKRVLGPDSPATLQNMVNLAIIYQKLNRHGDAMKLLEEALAVQKRVLPPDAPATLRTMHNLAISLTDLHRHAEALALWEEVLGARKRVLPPDHPDTLKGMGGLAFSYAALHRLEEALKLLEETLAAQKRALPSGHPETAITIYGIACMHTLLIPKADDKNKQADLAMNWLRQAVAAGFSDAAHMRKDTDLDALRDREDFKKLIAELEAKAEKK